MTKASSWSEVKAKAKNYGLVIIKFQADAKRAMECIVPKDLFDESRLYSFGYYYSPSTYAQGQFNPSGAGAAAVYINASAITISTEYYYD